jgi:hypothetical protein
MPRRFASLLSGRSVDPLIKGDSVEIMEPYIDFLAFPDLSNQSKI